MKVAVSVFEKLLITLIIFVFCIVVLVQIFVNNDVLGTIKANEDGTPVSMEQSSIYSATGTLEFSLTPATGATLLINGEEIRLSVDEGNQSYKLEVTDGDVLEVKNSNNEMVTFYLIDSSDQLTMPVNESKIECKKGITYLFKVKAEKIS